MKDFWETRYLLEKEIWGSTHSKTAEFCLNYYISNSVKSILIPGSGYGRNAKYFLENGIDVEGIEISEEAIDIGFTNGISYHVYNGSVLDMPFSTKKYEGIYCFNVLHLFKMEDRKNGDRD